MLTSLDYLVITAYLVAVVSFGIWSGGRQRTVEGYFLGNRDVPWWAVAFSVVATETSTLTIIGIPAVAYLGSLTFLQLTLGYFIGRLIVSVTLLPRYTAGRLPTAYALLGDRFGEMLRSAASVTFLGTRLLADGVRLFATAIPLSVMATMMGYTVGYPAIIAFVGVATIAYTLIGGVRAVIWMDVVQMSLYVVGAGVAIGFLLHDAPADWWALAQAEGKTQVFSAGTSASLSAWITEPYAFITAVVGGAIFSMASHGTDQLIVQRLLTCRSLADSQKALMGSAILVAIQFALFLIVGLLLWVHYAGASPAELGLTRGDEVFPLYIIEGLPAGLSGLLLAGIIAAAMSTLSSSLNALASSSLYDLVERWRGQALAETSRLRLSRALTLGWGVVFIGFAALFEDQQNPVVELGLAIASFTYGGLLGVFLLGLWARRPTQADALIAFLGSIGAMTLIIFGLWYSPTEGWLFVLNPTDTMREALDLQAVGWPWYTVIGSAITLLLGSLLGWRHR